MKKTLIICLAVSLFVTTVNANVLYIDNQDTVYVGDIFIATVYADITIDSYGIFLYNLSWDSDIVEAIDVINISDWEMLYSYGGGLHTGSLSLVNWWKMGVNKTGLIPLLEIRFTALNEGKTDFNFLSTPNFYSHTFNRSAEIYEFICIDSNITIKQENNDDNGDGGGGNNNGGNAPPPPVNQKPVALIDLPDTVYTNTTVNISGESSYDKDGTIVSYKWYFGDVVKEGPNVKHYFLRPDVYPVVLVVTDNQDTTDSTTEYITVFEKIPEEPEEPEDNEEPENNESEEPDIPDENITNYTGDVKKDEYYLTPLFTIILILSFIICLVFIFWYIKRPK